MNDYAAYDGVGLGELVKRREVTALELVDEAIRRVEAQDGELNAVVHRQFERARAEALRSGGEGRFAGVPFLLKDLMGEQQGEPSTSSCRLLCDWRAERDSELVARMRQSGVIVIGRTNTPELGIYAVTEPELRGAARNPWSRGHTPGGSSGGAAAAVAARYVPMAHGGDGGGSIRIPAAHCGLFGLKPTRGRNPMGPFVGERWGGLVAEHVLTRSVRDSAAMLDVTSGPDVGAPYLVTAPARPFLAEVSTPPGKLRIAMTTRALFADETHPDCVAAALDAAALCRELGHEVAVEHPRFDRETLVRAYLVSVAVGVANGVREAGEKAGRRPRAADFEGPTWLLKLIGEAVSAAEYGRLRNAVQRAGRELGEFFSRYDLLLTPTAARPPVPIGTFALGRAEALQLALLKAAPVRPLLMLALDELAAGAIAATPNTMLWNLTGQPAMSVPLCWNEAGLPIGAQFVGRFADEATLFRLAAQLEQARPWAAKSPRLA